jgi:hypothetical protein
VVGQGQIGCLLPLGDASQPNGIGLNKVDGSSPDEIAKIVEGVEVLA